MFAFPGFDQRRSRQYRNDPYANLFGDFYGTDRYGQDPYALRRQQWEEQQARRRAEQEAEQRRLQKQRQQMKKREQILKKYHAAATTIQRAYRSYKQRQTFAQQNRAALVVTNFMRRVAAQKQAQKVISTMKQLETKELELENLLNQYFNSPFGYRHLLWFNDALEKFIISLDNISIHGSTSARQYRKSLVRRAQFGFSVSDLVLKTMNKKAAFLQNKLRSGLEQYHEEEREEAARVLVKAFKSYPHIKKAKRVRNQLKDLEAAEAELETKRLALLASLQNVHALARSIQDLPSDSALNLQLKDLAQQATTMQTHIERPICIPKINIENQMAEAMDCDDDDEVVMEVDVNTTTNVKSSPTRQMSKSARRRARRKHRHAHLKHH